MPNPGCNCQSQGTKDITPVQKKDQILKTAVIHILLLLNTNTLKYCSSRTGVFIPKLTLSQLRFPKTELSTNALRHRLANLFCKYFRSVRPHGLCHNYPILPVELESSCQQLSKWMRVTVPMKLFMDTEIWISYNIHRNTILFAISIKHKVILIKDFSSLARYSWAAVCQPIP